MTVPFAKLHAAVIAERTASETRAALSRLAKALAGNKAYVVMRDFDQRSADCKHENAGEIFLSCFSEAPMRSELVVDFGKPVSLLSLLSGRMINEGLRRVMKHLAEFYGRGSECVVLFKMSHFGCWVAYNSPDPYPLSVPRVVLPSSGKMSSITFIPLTSYCRMWEAKKGSSANGQ